MPQIFYVLIDYPGLIVVPIAVLAALSYMSRSRTGWIVTAFWLIYLGYELGIKYRILCSECIKRSEMYVVYPLLALATAVAAVQFFVHLRADAARR